jgi:hypothetical protein
VGAGDRKEESMFWRYAVPLIIAAVFASLLFGWALAYWHDRKSREQERLYEEKMDEKWEERERRNDPEV